MSHPEGQDREGALPQGAVWRGDSQGAHVARGGEMSSSCRAVRWPLLCIAIAASQPVAAQGQEANLCPSRPVLEQTPASPLGEAGAGRFPDCMDVFGTRLEGAARAERPTRPATERDGACQAWFAAALADEGGFASSPLARSGRVLAGDTLVEALPLDTQALVPALEDAAGCRIADAPACMANIVFESATVRDSGDAPGAPWPERRERWLVAVPAPGDPAAMSAAEASWMLAERLLRVGPDAWNDLDLEHERLAWETSFDGAFLGEDCSRIQLTDWELQRWSVPQQSPGAIGPEADLWTLAIAQRGSQGRGDRYEVAALVFDANGRLAGHHPICAQWWDTEAHQECELAVRVVRDYGLARPALMIDATIDDAGGWSSSSERKLLLWAFEPDGTRTSLLDILLEGSWSHFHPETDDTETATESWTYALEAPTAHRPAAVVLTRVHGGAGSEATRRYEADATGVFRPVAPEGTGMKTRR
jgi:hypothetical protein